MRIAIRQEIERSEESRYDHRLHGLLLVTAGQSCREVAALFGENGTTVQRWVNRFEEGGLDALREGERSGRPAAAIWSGSRRAAMPATISRFGLSVTEAPPPSRRIGSAKSHASKKNSAVWLVVPTSNCGVLMNVIFSSTAPAAACA